MKAWEITGTCEGLEFIQYSTGNHTDVVAKNKEMWNHNGIRNIEFKELTKKQLIDIINEMI